MQTIPLSRARGLDRHELTYPQADIGLAAHGRVLGVVVDRHDGVVRVIAAVQEDADQRLVVGVALREGVVDRERREARHEPHRRHAARGRQQSASQCVGERTSLHRAPITD